VLLVVGESRARVSGESTLLFPKGAHNPLPERAWAFHSSINRCASRARAGARGAARRGHRYGGRVATSMQRVTPTTV